MTPILHKIFFNSIGKAIKTYFYLHDKFRTREDLFTSSSRISDWRYVEKFSSLPSFMIQTWFLRRLVAAKNETIRGRDGTSPLFKACMYQPAGELSMIESPPETHGGTDNKTMDIRAKIRRSLMRNLMLEIYNTHYLLVCYINSILFILAYFL